MDDVIELELDYGNIKIYNLQSTWIQAKSMSPGYMLCYEDSEYERGIIYRSNSKDLLIGKQEILMSEVAIGKKKIKL